MKPHFLDTQSQWFTHRGVRAPRALAGEALLHLEEEVAGDVAGEELGVGGGHLESLGDVDGGADDHVVGLLLERGQVQIQQLRGAFRADHLG